MQEHKVQIQFSGEEPLRSRRVASGMLLREVAELVDLTQDHCLLVENEAGALAGIVDSAEVASRLAARNATERRRWAETPIDSIVRVCMDSCTDGAVLRRDPDGVVNLAGTAVSINEQLVAIEVDDDLMVRWGAVKHVLQRAVFDPVTGMPNRTVFDRRLEEEWARVQRRETSISVMMIDLDHFKTLNDVHGHTFGDQVLRDVAECLSSELRSYDLLARYGGDEFAAILADCPMSELHIPVSRLQSGIARLAGTYDLRSPNLTVSVGAITCPGSLSIPSAHLIDAADECLYAAKNAGRGCAYIMDLALEGAAAPRRVPDDLSPAPQEAAAAVPRQ